MNDKQFGLTCSLLFGLLLWALMFFAIRGCVTSKTPQVASGGTIRVERSYTLDDWADAIRQAENNENYGIISIPCVKGEQCRKYCKNTVYNTLVKYREDRCKAGESDIDCLARRYCPIGSDTDDGTCQYWKDNVKYFLLSSL